MPALLDPTNDYVFKRLFAETPELRVALINDLRPDLPPYLTETNVKLKLCVRHLSLDDRLQRLMRACDHSEPAGNWFKFSLD
ncbi:hypothetical protein Thiowin_03663 [Thiorhodovibrio winogradskyi]|uniref:Uncharacterized protein n=1 Tax=Thiorhodovibrio winogradskyi TaxID=77007 RepID=A0ABZ0SDD8_9GAMM|nr:hypothetical protein [Thiorhodovibrio winogradskyi]